MANTKKALLSKRAAMIAMIGQNPGITSAEIATRLGLTSSNKVGTALWTAIRSGRVLTERVEVNSRFMNRHYLPDQLPADAVERVNQRIVDASNVIPPAGALSAANSVFNGPRTKGQRKNGRALNQDRKSTTKPLSTKSADRPQIVPKSGFSCAVASDGRLVLMRGDAIELSLSDVEASMLQSYLVKRATANLLASIS